MKENSRVRHASEDALIDQAIEAAEEYAEGFMNRPIMLTKFQLRVARVLPEITLPRPPLVELVSLAYTPKGDASVEVDLSSVTEREVDMLSTVTVADLSATSGDMTVVYTAGHEEASDVPSTIVRAVLLLASHFYKNREATFIDSRVMNVEKKIPYGVRDLLIRHRIPNADSMINGGY